MNNFEEALNRTHETIVDSTVDITEYISEEETRPTYTTIFYQIYRSNK